MKKLTIGLVALLTGYAANSLAALPTGVASRCDVNVPGYGGGFTFGVTGLYWRASSPDLDFALTSPSFTSGDFFSFEGESRRLNSKYDWGWSVNFGYVFPCSGNDFNLTYTHWDRSREGRVNGLAFPDFFPFTGLSLITPASFVFSPASVTISGAGTGGGQTFSVVGTFPNIVGEEDFLITVAPEDITGVSAKANFKNDTWDIDFGQAINVGCNFRLRWFGGLRYTRLNHHVDLRADATGHIVGTQPVPLVGEFTVTNSIGLATVTAGTATLTFDGTAAIHEAINRKSDFNGIGPRFGVDVNYYLGCGFGLVGSLATALIVGEIQTNLDSKLDVTPSTLATATFRTTGIPVVITGKLAQPEPVVVTGTGDVTFNGIGTQSDIFSFDFPDETRIVPNIDAKLGADWTYVFCNCSHTRVTFEAGYMVSHYFNAADRVSLIGAFAPEFRTRRTIDISFDGPYLGIQVAL